MEHSVTQAGIIVSTEVIEPQLRTDFWREVTRPIFETIPVDRDRSPRLEGTIKASPVGSLLIGETTFNQQKYNRNRKTILQGGLDHYLVQILVAGTLKGDFGKKNIVANPGDICIIDLAHVLESQVDAGTRLSLAIPRDDLEKAIGYRNVHGLVLKAALPMTRLLTDYLTGVLAVLTELPASQSLAVQDAMITLVAASCTDTDIVWSKESKSALTGVLRQRMLEFIDINISNFELGPEMLMHRFHISRAHLYRMFAHDGGVAKVVREKRLDAAYRELMRTEMGATRSVAMIAYKWGFSSGNNFLRAFQKRFGLTPSEARQEGFFLELGSKATAKMHAHFVKYGGR